MQQLGTTNLWGTRGHGRNRNRQILRLVQIFPPQKPKGSDISQNPKIVPSKSQIVLRVFLAIGFQGCEVWESKELSVVECRKHKAMQRMITLKTNTSRCPTKSIMGTIFVFFEMGQGFFIHVFHALFSSHLAYKKCSRLKTTNKTTIGGLIDVFRCLKVT